MKTTEQQESFDRQKLRDSFVEKMVKHMNKRLGPNWDQFLCPKCKAELKGIWVKVQDAKKKALSWQCPECGYYEFDTKIAEKVVKELRDKE